MLLGSIWESATPLCIDDTTVAIILKYEQRSCLKPHSIIIFIIPFANEFPNVKNNVLQLEGPFQMFFFLL